MFVKNVFGRCVCRVSNEEVKLLFKKSKKNLSVIKNGSSSLTEEGEKDSRKTKAFQKFLTKHFIAIRKQKYFNL